MKTLLKTALTSAFTAIVLSATAFTSSAALTNKSAIVIPGNQDIKKVIVTGNTKVYLVQSKREWVVVDKESDVEKVTIKQEGNTLRISSSEDEPVVVTVYVKDIFRIDAANNAVVRTAGNFNVKNLQVMLKDNAKARVKATTESLYTVLSGGANLELIGTTDTHIIKSANEANLKMSKFAALKTDRMSSSSIIAVNTNVRGGASNKVIIDSLKTTKVIE